MAGLLYYLPGEDPQRPNAVDRKRVEALGLGYAFDGSGQNPTPSGVQHNGPDGGSGVIVADGSRFLAKKIGYYRGDGDTGQQWRKAAGLAAWVGYYRDARPAAADLARAAMLDGFWLTLADGDRWLVPLARGWSGLNENENPGWYHALPRRTDLDDAGNWVPGDVLERHKRLWEVATGWWDAKQGAIAAAAEESRESRVESPEQEILRAEFEFDSFGGVNDAAAYVLGCNYRVSKTEIALLGLFDTDAPQKILDATIDWQTFVEWIQKKTRESATSEPAGSSTAAGPAAATPGTGPP